MAETKKKPAFGGVTISFAGQTATLEQVFGKKPLAPTALCLVSCGHLFGRMG